MAYEKQGSTRTNQELLDENFALKQRIKELEHSESERRRLEKEALANQLIFQQTLIEGQAVANLVTDARLATLAIEYGCELISTDSDFARFPKLKWRNPLSQST